MGENKINPYLNQDNIRTFSKDVDPLSLVWHSDREDRMIEVLEGEGWKVQLDNRLPLALVKGDHIFITKGKIHRVLKGTTDLKIKIKNINLINMKCNCKTCECGVSCDCTCCNC